jgi:hypothetical protein
VNTHLPDLAELALILSGAALPATTLLAGFGAGLAALFFSTLRALADGAVLTRTGMDGFDFAAVFLGLATALAMTAINPQEMKRCAPYTTLGGPAQAANPVSRLHMKPLQESQTDQAVENEKDRYHEIEQSRHDQDQQSRND